MLAAQLKCCRYFNSGSETRQNTVFIVDACQESTSRLVRMTLASGYASMSSFAKATAGQSHTAWQFPSSWSQSARVKGAPTPSYFAARASIHIRASGGFSIEQFIIW